MTRLPKASVIIPMYNRASLLKTAVENILHQTYQDYEIVAVDDGSTDHMAPMMGDLIRQQPGGAERIRYLFQENRGKSAALNCQLGHARDEWIAFLDSDDEWTPNHNKELLDAAAVVPEDVAWIFGDPVRIK